MYNDPSVFLSLPIPQEVLRGRIKRLRWTDTALMTRCLTSFPCNHLPASSHPVPAPSTIPITLKMSAFVEQSRACLKADEVILEKQSEERAAGNDSTETPTSAHAPDTPRVRFRHHLACGDHPAPSNNVDFRKELQSGIEERGARKCYRHHLASGLEKMGDARKTPSETIRSCCPSGVKTRSRGDSARIQLKIALYVDSNRSTEKDGGLSTIDKSRGPSVTQLITDTQEALKKLEAGVEAKRLLSERRKHEAVLKMVQHVCIAFVAGQAVMSLSLFGLIAFLK